MTIKLNSAQLALGSAQFGLNYGISNSTGQVNAETISAILQQAKILNVNWLDTAQLYGSAELNLGRLAISQQFSIITKLPELTEDAGAHKALVCSLQRLNRQNVDTVLLHRPEQLRTSSGSFFYEQLRELKNLGLCKRIGVSVYSPLELKYILDNFQIDVVQLPMNLFDQRFFQHDLLEHCASIGVSVHVRSLFLQGLLMMTTRPLWTLAYNEAFQKMENLCNEFNINKLTLAFIVLRLAPAVELGVVGCTNIQELLEIDKAWKLSEVHVKNQNLVKSIKELSQADDNLINPLRWPKKTF